LRAGSGPGACRPGTGALPSGAARGDFCNNRAGRLSVGAGGARQDLADGPVPPDAARAGIAPALSPFHAGSAPGAVSPDRHTGAPLPVCRTTGGPLSGAVL